MRRTFFGLQFRFTVLVLLLALSVGGLTGGLLFDLTGELTGRQARRKCLQIASLLATSAADAFDRGDTHALAVLADELSTGDPIEFVIFADSTGRPIATADPTGFSSAALDAEGHVKTDDGTLGQPLFVGDQQGSNGCVHVTYPIIAVRSDPTEKRQLLGYLRVGMDVEGAARDLAAVFDLSSGVSIGVLLLAVPLAYLVVRCVVVPLNELSQVVRRLAHGDLEARSTVRRSDEIGDLSSAFNGMADELAQQHKEITALNTDLEERVNQRTRQLRELASREPLTGLYNRRHFNEVLASRFSEAVRYGSQLSCVMIDLDDFKAVNDRFGHHVGDELLILTSITIASQLRAADVAARYGGDEFIILLPQTDAQRAQVLAARIASKFALDLAEQLPDVRVSLSIGIASTANPESASPEDLIRAADRAMYAAKDGGKSQIVTANAPA
ncbi:MAG: diguanylate cyclase [Planctomycetes bacterium]|nr:diguanylate cyclase [Planctomycetota bacterium]